MLTSSLCELLWLRVGPLLPDGTLAPEPSNPSRRDQAMTAPKIRHMHPLETDLYPQLGQGAFDVTQTTDVASGGSVFHHTESVLPNLSGSPCAQGL